MWQRNKHSYTASEARSFLLNGSSLSKSGCTSRRKLGSRDAPRCGDGDCHADFCCTSGNLPPEVADVNGRPHGSPNREAPWRHAVPRDPCRNFVNHLRLKHCEMGIVAFDDEFKQNHREACGTLSLNGRLVSAEALRSPDSRLCLRLQSRCFKPATGRPHPLQDGLGLPRRTRGSHRDEVVRAPWRKQIAVGI